jgi:hypothetical protein
MAWAHEAVAMAEVLGLVPGFVDILVLAGGRTSSGAPASWRSGDVQKALRWALFFEEVTAHDPAPLGFASYTAGYTLGAMAFAAAPGCGFPHFGSPPPMCPLRSPSPH